LRIIPESGVAKWKSGRLAPMLFIGQDGMVSLWGEGGSRRIHSAGGGGNLLLRLNRQRTAAYAFSVAAALP